MEVIIELFLLALGLTCIHFIMISVFKNDKEDDEIMECCENFDENGVYLRKKLEELLGE